MKNILYQSLILLSFLFVFSIKEINAQNYDTVYQNKIIKSTTDKRFLPSSVLAFPKNDLLPSPLEHFGSIIGAPGVLHRSNEVYSYFKKLASLSGKLKMEQIGTSEEGRAIQLITISDEQTINKLEQYKKSIAQLADPRNLNQEKAEQLINEGKAIYFLNGAMHSGETGSPEMLMELAFRLISDNSEEIKHILENCIILINPVSEPDGRDKHVDWYYRYSKGRKN